MTTTAEPPFRVPLEWRAKAPRGWQMKEITEHSDGNSQRWPSQPFYSPADDRNYLIRLATDWVNREGSQQEGVAYYLNRLPQGYACFEQERPGGPQNYKRLFGHPSGRFYDSIVKYEKHFLWLVDGMQGECLCVLCVKGTDKVVIPRVRKPREPPDQILPTQRRGREESDSGNDSTRSSHATGIAMDRARRKIRSTHGPRPVDSEGVPDIWKDCIRLAMNHKGTTHGIEIDITEPESIDWESERSSLPRYLTQVEQQHSFVPRIGELVLWTPFVIDGIYILRNPETDEYQLYSFEHKRFVGRPPWRAGVVAAVPNSSSQNGMMDFQDLLYTQNKRSALNTAGFRIETLPDPNDVKDKSLSKQYKYVPLQNIRPLSHWKLLLKGVAQNQLHPSILNAITCMTAVSLVEKWRFKGDWPNGVIFAKGIYIGSELITIGDTVRVNPRTLSDENIHPDILVVESIRLYLEECQPVHATANSSSLCTSSWIALTGTGYTLNAKRAAVATPLSTDAMKREFRSVGTDSYGSWYPIHDTEKKRYQLSHEQILGRLYEADAVRLWIGQCQVPSTSVNSYQPYYNPPDLFFDAASILNGRRYATLTDARFEEPTGVIDPFKGPFSWNLTDSRGQGLAITSLNGIELTQYHKIRTPATMRTWKANLSIAKGKSVDESMLYDVLLDRWEEVVDPSAASKAKARGRPAGSKMIDGKLYTAEQLAEMPGLLDNNPCKAQGERENMTDEKDASLGLDDRSLTNDKTKIVEKQMNETSRQQRSSSQMAGAALIEIGDSDNNADLAALRDQDQGEDNAAFAQSATYSRKNGNATATDVSANPSNSRREFSDAEQASRLDRQSTSNLLAQALFSNEREDKDMRDKSIFEEDEELDLSESERHQEVEDEDWLDREDSWKDLRYARGGTEETEGGDYRP